MPPGKRERITLGRRDIRRISKVVRNAERGDRDMEAPHIRTSDDGTEIVRGSFSAPWAKGSTKTVTHSAIQSQTYEGVKNYFATVSGDGTKSCAIAFVCGEWILIAAEC